MSIPQPNEEFQFVSRQKQPEPSKKVLDLAKNKRKSEEDTVYFLTHLFAIKAIDCWLEQKKYPLSIQAALKSLGLRIESEKWWKRDEFELINFLQQSDSEAVGDLAKELEIRADDSYRKYFFDANCSESLTLLLLEVKKDLEKWYKESEGWGCHFTLKANFQTLRGELHERFYKIASYWERASVRSSLEFFRELDSFLLSFQNEYEKERDKYLDKENSSRQTYKRYFSAIEYGEHRGDLDELHNNFALAQKSLSSLYKFKIRAEVYSSAIKLLNRLRDNTQNYTAVIDEANNFLTDTQVNFAVRIDVREESNLFLALLAGELAKQIDFGDLREKVEKRVGFSLLNWKTYKTYGHVTVQDAQKAIIEELMPITKEICSKMYRQLSRQVDSFETVDQQPKLNISQFNK